jgi:Secretion system C-terminal sorting domain
LLETKTISILIITKKTIMKRVISLIILSMFVFTVQAQTVPTVTPANPTVHCGDTAIITASGSTGNYIWYSDFTYTNIIGTNSTIYLGPLGNDTTIYVAAIAPKTTIIETYNFTNCGITGRTGPIQTEVNTAYSGTSLDGDVTITTQGIQEWIVPTTGFYNIETAGAKGSLVNGGPGAILKADILLTAGDTLQILIGQQGIDVGTTYAGGGGGSFVAKGNSHTTATPLIIAGGGGAVYLGHTLISNSYGSTSTSGSTGHDGISLGGTNGNGGDAGISTNTPGAGGGGFYTNGDSMIVGLRPVQGGFAFQNGGNGGQGETSLGSGVAGRPDGGFGGAGGSGNTGGGGGGYSGGGSTDAAVSGDMRATGGGGSFIEPTALNVETSDGNYDGSTSFNSVAIINSSTYNSGDGYVTISLLDDTLSALVTVNITVDSLPEITVHPVNSAIPSGTNTGFTVTATGVGLNYQWQESTNSGTTWTNLTNTAPYSGVTTATLTITAATGSLDAYYYRCIVDGNCPPPDTSNAGILSITDVGINDFSINKTTVYPNPVNDILLVKIDNKTSDFVQISIYDVLGKLLMEFPKENLFKGVNSFDLNVRTLAKGVYYLRVRMDKEQNTFKLIKN